MKLSKTVTNPPKTAANSHTNFIKEADVISELDLFSSSPLSADGKCVVTKKLNETTSMWSICERRFQR